MSKDCLFTFRLLFLRFRFMAKFRYKDKEEEKEHGQILGYYLWMGGRQLTYVGGAICEDGEKANWFATDDADTFFSIPGYIHKKGKKIKGFVTVEDNLYKFISDKF